MYNHFTNSPILIAPDELIVGTLGCPKKAGPVFPEYGVDWVVEEMKNGLMNYSEVRTHDYFWYDDKCIEQLEEIQPYWRGKSVADVAMAVLTDEELKGSPAGKKVFSNINYVTSGPGHLGINYDFILKKGFRKIREEIEEKLKALDFSNPADFQKEIFYRAALITNAGGTNYIRRHAELADKMAREEKDPVRRAELMQIAENCAWIATEPPRTFWEAIQMVYFANNLVLMESNGHSVSYGRFDQYMYPFYKHDIETGAADAPSGGAH
jgi:formate C-acetyltransferase